MVLALILWAAPAADLNPPRVVHEPPTMADAQGNWRLWFEVRDESPLFGAALYVRTETEEWKTIEPDEVAKGWFEAVVPARAGLRYFFEVFDEHGNGPTRVGSAEVPFVLNEPTGVLPALRPWDGLTQAPPPTVATPWWQRRPPRRWLTAAVGTLAVTGVAWGSYALFRARPVSSVTLVPVSASASP